MRSAAKSCAIGAVGLLVVGGAGSRAVGATHAESGDAGDGTGGAFQIAGVVPGDPLTSITGATSGAGNDFVDAYLIEITDPAQFFATTTSGTGFDTMLYLFGTGGNGLLANDDVSGSILSTLGNTSDDGTGVVVGVGQYILAVTGFQMDPVNTLGQKLFDIPIGSLTEVSGPDGAGGADPATDWQDNTVLGGAATGAYTITLRGVNVVPTPGVVGIAGVAGLGVGVRRRRR